MTTRSLHIMMVGLRGFPNVQGGVERHVENLAKELVALGCVVTVLVRPRYQHQHIGHEWNGIRLRKIWAPLSAKLEAIIHTFLGVLYAAVVRPDILHIHAIGPALLTPLARLLGLRVIVTHHGEDYNRQKWGLFAKKVLKLGEKFGMRYANARIAISAGIRNSVAQRFGLTCAHISNGVELPDLSGASIVLQRFTLAPRRYVLLVSRFVPEKRHLDLIHAFLAARMPGWKLVLVGKPDHDGRYAGNIQAAADGAANIVCPGFLSGQALHEIYLHAGCFVLPSSHEGLPISILEAMSYGLPIIASDIPPNREIPNDAIDYFPVGDVAALTRLLESKVNSAFEPQRCDQIREIIRSQYRWCDIAEKTYSVYAAVRFPPGPSVKKERA
jgi:glycosyltransferase involved in cell wall biosynthesis